MFHLGPIDITESINKSELHINLQFTSMGASRNFAVCVCQSMCRCHSVYIFSNIPVVLHIVSLPMINAACVYTCVMYRMVYLT